MLAEPPESLQLNGKELSSPCPDSGQSVHSPGLLRVESPIPFRWESINALDIAAVLDSTFPSSSASSTLTCEEGYTLYDDDDFWMQPEFTLRQEIENCVADPICEDENVMDVTSSEDMFATNINQTGEDCASLFISSQDEKGLADCNWGNINGFTEIGETTSLSTFGEMADDTICMARFPSSSPSLLGCSVQKEISPLQPSNSSFCGKTRDLTPVIESTAVSSVTQCSSADTRSEMTSSQHSYSDMDIKPQMLLPVPVSDANESFDGRKARASRVAANQRRAGGRAKKYLPYKLIPMSSPHATCRTGTIEHSSSKRGVVRFPFAQQPLQSVGIARGPQYQSTVPRLPVVNGNEHQIANESSEIGQIEQLKHCVRQLDKQTRLCIRDSLYRLARSAKERQNEADSRLANKFMKKPVPSRISGEGAVEAETNPFDRWVVNLLFYKQPNLSNTSCQSYVPLSAEATSQVMLQSTIMNQASQPWNSCGFVPDFRLCTC